MITINDAQLQPITTIFNDTQQLSGDTGSMVSGMAVTATLHVSPNGDNTDGSSVAKAYTTIQAALDAASINGDDLTLILVAPHATNYDINTTGDPTWSANILLTGSNRTWAKIKNTHGAATSIMKLTGKSGICCLNFNLGTGSANGVIMTHGGYFIEDCQFVGAELTGAATALHINGTTLLKHGRIERCEFDGHVTHMTGLLLNNAHHNNIIDVRLHKCLTGAQITHADSDENFFSYLDIGDCALGLDLDAGNEQHFHHVDFHGNILNVDDEVGDHHWQLIHGHLPLTSLPDDFTGVNLDTGLAADTWGTDTEILAAAGRTKPFRVIGIAVEADANEKFRIRLSSDSGSSYFADTQIEGQVAAVQRQSISLPSGTEEIFNYNTRISGSAKSETGTNTATVWLQIQEI